MEDSLRGRAKPKKIRVRFPDGTVYCYSSVKETFLETLKKIDPKKLYEVKLEVCHLPMFTRLVKGTAYELYKDFMEPIGNGWYVNIQGDTYNKFVQLKNISEQLGLGLEIDLSEDFKGEKVARGSKGMAVLEVTFPDHTVIGEENTNETFMQCIWHLGIDNVRKLNLKHGGKDLITSSKLYRGQVQVDVNRWLVVPGALKDKVKILRVISAMLHVKLDITSFSTNESKSYKRIGNRHTRKTNAIQNNTINNSGKFHIGDFVYHNRYGEGEVEEFDEKTRSYKVLFYNKFKGLSKKYQKHIVAEDDLSSSEETRFEHTERKDKIEDKGGKQTDGQVKEHKEEPVRLKQTVQTPSTTKSVTSNSIKVERLPKKHIDSKFNYGDIVYHKTFGKGIVRQFFSGTKTYRVRFYGKLPRPTQVVDEDELSIKPLTAPQVIKKEDIQQPIKTEYSESKSLSPKFKVGEKVFCKYYGDGVVIGFDYKKDKVSYIVRFAIGTSRSSGKIVIMEGTELRKKD